MYSQVPVRHGSTRQRDLTFPVKAPDAVAALRAAADLIPEDLSPNVDLIELRIVLDPDGRARKAGIDSAVP